MTKDFCLKRSQLHNFADDNTISATCKCLQELTDILGQESESAVLCFRQNEMIYDRDKCQAIILKSKSKTKVNLNICNENVSITDTGKLLGIEIDKGLMIFYTHTAKLCSKAAAQLNAINRLNRYLGKSEKAAIIYSFSRIPLDD